MIPKSNKHICTLDIGSSKVSACVARIKGKRIKEIYFESEPSKGIKHGLIVDSIDLVNLLGRLLKNLKTKSGIKIKYIYTNISGQDLVTKHSRAIVPLAERGNKVITATDIQIVNEQARILGSSLEEEIIHLIPSSYTIDSKANIVNPMGLYSHKLEVDLFLVCAKLSSVQSLSRAISQSGYEIRNLFLSGLAASKAVFSHDFKDGINIFCDIGADITELLIFRNGNLSDIQVLPVGGNNLTQNLSDALKIPLDLAEDIKRSHGIITDPNQIAEDKEILVKKSDFYKPIKQRLVTEIVSSQAKFICSQIKEALEKRVSFYQISNFVVAGRTVLLEGFIETLENALAIPVKLARLSHPQISALAKDHPQLSGRQYLAYLACLGILCDIVEDKKPDILPVQQPATKNPILKAVNRFKEVYQEYF